VQASRLHRAAGTAAHKTPKLILGSRLEGTMRSIAIMNRRRRGKTTTAVNLSAALAASAARLSGRSRPQATPACTRIEPRPEELSIYNLLAGRRASAKCVGRWPRTFWLIPSSLDLAAAELELVARAGRS